MHTFLKSICFGFPVALAAIRQPSPQPPAAVFAQVGLTPQQVAAIDEGRAVAKVLSWGGPSEVYVFGAVYIDGPAAAYVKAARNVSKLAGSEGYLGIGELPATATAADLSALTLEP